MKSQNVGKLGEDLVCQYLRNSGFKILKRNFRTCFGEIDIIAYRKGHTSFVEVKTRSTDAFGTPAEAVGAVKRRAIVLAAQEYILQNNNANADFSFDVAEVFLKERKPEIHYIENAFAQ